MNPSASDPHPRAKPARLRCTAPAFLAILLAAISCTRPPAPVDVEDVRATLAREMEHALTDQLLDVWYPLVLDEEHGGFLSTFTYDWTPQGPQDKMIVTQARHVWTTSKATRRFPDHPLYRSAAAHGFAFLRDKMWDEEHGGFYTLVDRTGTVKAEDGAVLKRAYGNAFAIYGLAAYYGASGDTAALHLAQEAFRWLEAHSHDPVHGGYFQFLARDGTPFPDGYGETPPKDQNSSIHLLEAFTELYGVWPDALLRERLLEMLLLIRDTMTTEAGYLQLFFRRDWTPVSYRDAPAAVREAHYNLDHVSFGHDVETAYLMLEAAHALGLPTDTTLTVGKRMVDHALRNGWDDAVGGFYDRGYYFQGAGEMTILEDTKNWWAQAEGLNTLLLMADTFPDDSLRYFDQFRKLWTYAKTYLIDAEHGDWYAGGLDKQPDLKTGLKAHIWKGNYHTARSLMNCIQRLRSGG